MEGNVAEVIQEKENLHLKLVCRNKHILFSISDINDIQLGDHIEIEGKFKVKRIVVNGIEHLYK